VKKQLGIIAAAALVGAGVAVAHGPGPPVAGKGPAMTVQGSAQAKLWIRHVERGCHVWTDGRRTNPTAAVTLRRGSRLVVTNQDTDMHQLVQTAGPRIATGPFLMMNQAATLVFRKPGVYRFKNRKLDMPGMHEVETIGRDWLLLLTVTVR